MTRAGLQNACSVAGMVLTTQAVITEKPKKTPKVNPMQSGANVAPGYMSL